MSWKITKSIGRGDDAKVIKTCTVKDVKVQPGSENKVDWSDENTKARFVAATNIAKYPTVVARFWTTSFPVLARPYIKDGEEVSLHVLVQRVQNGLSSGTNRKKAELEKKLGDLKNLREDFEDVKKDRQEKWLERRNLKAISDLDDQIKEIEEELEGLGEE